MSQDLLEQKELWNVGTGATTTTIPMVTQSRLSVALSTASQAQLAGSTFDCAIGATRCIAIVNSVSASGVLTLDSALPSAPAQDTQFVLTPTQQTLLTGSNIAPVVQTVGPITIPAGSNYLSSGYSIPVNSATTSVNAACSVSTSATANWNLYAYLNCGGVVGAAANIYTSASSKTTGTGTQSTLSSSLNVYGGYVAGFKVLNNDVSNAITLNAGQVNVH